MHSAQEFRCVICVVAYTIFPDELFKSVEASGISVEWQIHYHGRDQSIADSLQDFARSQRSAQVFDHRENRGLALSWNDTLRSLRANSGDICLIVNDDLSFIEGGFAMFLEFISDHESKACGQAFYTVRGREIGASEYAGQVHIQMMSCCAVNVPLIDHVGYFDERFTPAYFED